MPTKSQLPPSRTSGSASTSSSSASSVFTTTPGSASTSNLYALNADGSLKWKYATGEVVRSSPAVGADGTVYVGSDDKNLYALNADSFTRA